MAPYTASSAGSPAGSDNRIIQPHMGLQMRALDRDANFPENVVFDLFALTVKLRAEILLSTPDFIFVRISRLLSELLAFLFH